MLEACTLKRENVRLTKELERRAWQLEQEVLEKTELLDQVRKAEEAIMESEGRLRLALDAAQMCTWDWDIMIDQVNYNGYQEQLFGKTSEIFGSTYDMFLELVHPADRERIRQAMVHAIKETTSCREVGVSYRSCLCKISVPGEFGIYQTTGAEETD